MKTAQQFDFILSIVKEIVYKRKIKSFIQTKPLYVLSSPFCCVRT